MLTYCAELLLLELELELLEELLLELEAWWGMPNKSPTPSSKYV